MSSSTKNICLSLVVLTLYPRLGWAIYGPPLERADVSIAAQSCREAKFEHSEQVVDAMQSQNPADILRVLGAALREWKSTARSSSLYPARAFCIHELVPARLQPGGTHYSPSRVQPTATVKQFGELGIEYFYYDPDDEFTLRDDPVDLEELATDHQDSPWGRQAFLMMTRLGWSQGACSEGPDQFREVIKHGETFLTEHPDCEVSDDVRLETAKAYATWWHVSQLTPQTGGPDDPARYLQGSGEARRRAIELYHEYLSSRKTADKDVERRLKSLEENSMDPRKRDYDYWCPDYED